jgi:hypothetical protein
MSKSRSYFLYSNFVCLIIININLVNFNNFIFTRLPTFIVMSLMFDIETNSERLFRLISMMTLVDTIAKATCYIAALMKTWLLNPDYKICFHFNSKSVI